MFESCTVSESWGHRAAFPNRGGQQVKHRSLLAADMKKDMTLPERDAGGDLGIILLDAKFGLTHFSQICLASPLLA